MYTHPGIIQLSIHQASFYCTYTRHCSSVHTPRQNDITFLVHSSADTGAHRRGGTSFLIRRATVPLSCSSSASHHHHKWSSITLPNSLVAPPLRSLCFTHRPMKTKKASARSQRPREERSNGGDGEKGMCVGVPAL